MMILTKDVHDLMYENHVRYCPAQCQPMQRTVKQILTDVAMPVEKFTKKWPYESLFDLMRKLVMLGALITDTGFIG